ncbi:MAG: hypothetical protein ACETWR_00870 [Anaerolineae bacterium]
MDARKDYVAPAIAAEDALEQTSLACNMTSAVFYFFGCAAQINQKNGGFWGQDWGAGLCDYPVFDWVAICEPDAGAPWNVDVVGTLFS